MEEEGQRRGREERGGGAKRKALLQRMREREQRNVTLNQQNVFYVAPKGKYRCVCTCVHVSERVCTQVSACKNKIENLYTCIHIYIYIYIYMYMYID